MASSFPEDFDVFINPQPTDSVLLPSHSAQHSNSNDAVEALQIKVGTNNSTDPVSHDYRISQVEALVGSAVSGSKSIVQDVRNQSGFDIQKGTPVYISGSEGASGKVLISVASSSQEISSSKTAGITSSSISNNSNGQIVTEGILEGVDTTGAADGDPVWLGLNGQKIFGYANKPSAPSHLVFLGIVVRGGQQNTGSIYIKIQNGFELEELHNVSAVSPNNGDILRYNSSSNLWEAVEQENFSVQETVISNISFNAVSSWDTSLYTTVEYILQIKQGSSYRSSKILVLTDKTQIVNSEYSILEIGDEIIGLEVESENAAGQSILKVRIPSAETTNAVVRVTKTSIQ